RPARNRVWLDDRRIVECGETTLRIVDIDGRSLRSTTTPCSNLELTFDKSTIATRTGDEVVTWRVETLQPLARFIRDVDDSVFAPAPSGRWVAAAHRVDLHRLGTDEEIPVAGQGGRVVQGRLRFPGDVVTVDD